VYQKCKLLLQFNNSYKRDTVKQSSGGGSNLKVRGHMASAERDPIRGSGGGAPSGVQGQSPRSGGQGGEAPLKLKGFLGIIRRKNGQYLPLYPTFESAEISPKPCLQSK